jgi:hypothetical protein
VTVAAVPVAARNPGNRLNGVGVTGNGGIAYTTERASLRSRTECGERQRAGRSNEPVFEFHSFCSVRSILRAPAWRIDSSVIHTTFLEGRGSSLAFARVLPLTHCK